MTSQQTRTVEEQVYVPSGWSVSAFTWPQTAQLDSSWFTLSPPYLTCHPELCPQHVKPALTGQTEEEPCVAFLSPQEEVNRFLSMTAL